MVAILPAVLRSYTRRRASEKTQRSVANLSHAYRHYRINLIRFIPLPVDRMRRRSTGNHAHPMGDKRSRPGAVTPERPLPQPCKRRLKQCRSLRHSRVHRLDAAFPLTTIARPGVLPDAADAPRRSGDLLLVFALPLPSGALPCGRMGLPDADSLR